MSYYVESDGDRVPKDVYICESDGCGRILTMECASEDRRFRLARRICNMLNGSDAGFKAGCQKELKDRGHND
jgi:hypothetical protein